MTKLFHVISVVLVLIMMVSLVNVNAVSAKTENNIVIRYFSAIGTTKGAAKKIKKATKNKMIAIKDANPYTEEDLDYGDDNSRVTKEHESADDSTAESTVRPEIEKAVKKADVVYIGYDGSIIGLN